MRSPRSSEFIDSLPAYGILFVMAGSSGRTILNKRTVHDEKVRIALCDDEGRKCQGGVFVKHKFRSGTLFKQDRKGEVRNFNQEKM